MYKSSFNSVDSSNVFNYPLKHVNIKIISCNYFLARNYLEKYVVNEVLTHKLAIVSSTDCANVIIQINKNIKLTSNTLFNVKIGVLLLISHNLIHKNQL